MRQHHDVRVYQSFILTFVSEPHSSNPLKVAVKLFSLSMEVEDIVCHVECLVCFFQEIYSRTGNGHSEKAANQGSEADTPSHEGHALVVACFLIIITRAPKQQRC